MEQLAEQILEQGLCWRSWRLEQRGAAADGLEGSAGRTGATHAIHGVPAGGSMTQQSGMQRSGTHTPKLGMKSYFRKGDN